MSTIINHPQVPPPDVTPEFAAYLEVAAAERGLPPDPWPLPSGPASPEALAQAQAASARQCPLCEAAPGTPCQPMPCGDHLARFLDEHTAGKLTRAYMAMVLGELVVVASWRIVPDGAR